MNVLLIAAAGEYIKEDTYHKWASELAFSLKILRTSENQVDYCSHSYDGLIVSNLVESYYEDIKNSFNNTPTVYVSHEISARNCHTDRHWIVGRKDKNIRWAMRLLRSLIQYEYKTLSYGSAPWQCMQEFTSTETNAEKSTCIVFHGGFFQPCYGYDLTLETCNSLSKYFSNRIINVEYIPWDKEIIYSKEITKEIEFFSEYTASLKDNITIIGHSAGAIPAMILARQLSSIKYPFNIRLVLLSPFHDTEDSLIVKDTKVHKYLRKIIDTEQIQQFFNAKLAETIDVIHGQLDDTISCESSINFCKKLSLYNDTQMHVLSEFSHMDITRSEGVESAEMVNILIKTKKEK